MRLKFTIRAAAASLILAIAVVLGVRSIAEAHTTLVASEPAIDATLTSPPSRVRLVFSEQIEAGMASIALVGADGASRPLSVVGDPHDVHAIIGAVSGLSTGVFRVVWHVVSADGHPVGGSFLFTVGTGGARAVAPPELPVSEPAATWGPTLAGAPLVPAVLRGLAVGSLMAVAGLLLFIVWMGSERDTRAMTFARRLVAIAPLLTLAHLAAWMLNAAPDHRLTGDWMDAAMGSTVGRVELWRTILSLAPLWALVLARRTTLALALTIAALLASAAIGHAAATDAVVAIPAKALHLLAGAAWLGCLLWLILRTDADDPRADRDALRVSSVALAAVIVVLFSGVVQTLILVPIRDLVSTYGAVVGAKLIGVVVLVAFGAYNRLRVLPRLADGTLASAARGSLRLTVRREVAVMTIVILLGGLLSYVSPPAGAGPASHTNGSDAHS